MLLTDIERQKFITYCHQIVSSAQAVAEQLKETGAGGAVNGLLIRRELTKAAAYHYVAEDLDACEVQSVAATSSS